MPSPFPGMDPYIEDPFFWSDFHGSMMGIMREALNAILPRRYTASMERHVWVQEHNGEEVTLLGSPDVQVADRTGGGTSTTATAALAEIAAPVTTVLPLTRSQGNRFLRILDRHRRRIVTVIELLSPANKTTTGYGVAYRQKRWDYLASDVSLVEIDLLRAGERPPIQSPPPAPSDYYVLVCTAAGLPQAGFWPLSVRDLLPPVPVPLDPGERHVLLDLRACLDRAYDGGRYADEIDYRGPPNPPLREPDATWARELLAARSAETN
jgi:Protein of unknown function (DUF4058)